MAENQTHDTLSGAVDPAATCSLPQQFKPPFYAYPECPGKIFMQTQLGDTTVLDVRGWGYLTGGGALNMPQEEAEKAQDAFAAWVVEALNRHAENDKDQATRGA